MNCGNIGGEEYIGAPSPPALRVAAYACAAERE